MLGIQNYANFIAAILVFQLVPGAGTVAILNATARNGIGAGMGAVLGTLVGDFIFMTAAFAGLAAVMRAHPLVFSALQWFGACYLVWLGLQLLRTRTSGMDAAAESRKSAWIYFRQGIAVSLTNPKVILFFVAFFPLFMRVDSRPSTLAAMMAHVTLISLLYQTGLVVVGNAVARKLKAWPSARTIATRIAGMALVGLGIKLAIDNR